MTQSTPARDFLLPRLTALVTEAGTQGITRDVAVAVLIDLVTGSGFNDVALDPKEDVAPEREPNGSLTKTLEEGITEVDATGLSAAPFQTRVPSHYGRRGR